MARRRFVGDGMQDHIVCANHSEHPVEFELGLELGSDFADIFTVKAFDSALGDPREGEPAGARARLLRPARERLRVRLAGRLRGPHSGAPVRCGGTVEGGTVRYRVALGPRERWQLRVDVIAAQDGESIAPRTGRSPLRRRARARPGVARRLAAPRAAAAQHLGRPRTTRSRARSPTWRRCGCAAWVSTVSFRRPACRGSWPSSAATRIITCLQTLLFGPELAQSALHTLAELQADADDAAIDAEPGKIVHEVRNGRGARAWFPRLLRHARRHAALPRAPLRGVALDGRRRARPGPEGAGPARARMDRQLRRPRRRRLRRVPAALGARAREPVLERLRRSRRSSPTGGLPAADRAGRGTGLRLRREAAHRRAGARDLARPRARRAARARGRRARSGDSTRRSGSTSAAATTRSRLDADKSSRSTRCARTDRPSALERHRPARAGRRGRRPAHGRGALVGLGRADDVRRRTPASTRSSTTTGRSGRTTTR